MTSTTAFIQEAERLGKYIREVRKSQELSLDDLADKTGVSRQHLWRIEKPEDGVVPRVSAHVIGLIADVLGLDLNDLYVTVGWRKTRYTGPKVEDIAREVAGSPYMKELLAAAGKLTTEQRRLLVNMATIQGAPSGTVVQLDSSKRRGK